MWWAPLLNNLIATLDAGASGAAGSFESIATATGTGSSGTITFTSIPSTYKHLQIRYIGRYDGASVTANSTFTINSDTGANYAIHDLVGNGSAASSGGTASASSIRYARVAGSTATASVVAAGIIDIHDYASTSKYKTVRILSGVDGNAADTNYQISLRSGLWMNTNAITSLTFTTASGNWTTATQFALYGIKGA
jgi:hypothetical protein